MMKKFLAICLTQRIIHKLDAKIPPSQVAYRQGRSTTERVFTTKVLVEKAITLKYMINLLMLHPSKAFDKTDSAILLKDFQTIPDATELVKIMSST